MRQYKFILSGGTGGHIYPYCYRYELKLRFLLLNFFVGAKDKWKCIPQAGFQIKGLWISVYKENKFTNLMFPKSSR
jgi:hypothetical protein